MVPETVTIEGTVRTFDKALRKKVLQRIEGIVKDTAHAYGAEGNVTFSEQCPAVVNDAEMVEQMALTVQDTLGQENLEYKPHPAMGSEDFGFFAERLPSLQIRMGTGSDEIGGRLGVHNPAVIFQEDVIRTGAAVLTSFLFSPYQQGGSIHLPE